MLCEFCQENQATVHIKKTINGSKQELILCENCAAEQGHLNGFSDPFSFHQFVFGMLGGENQQIQRPTILECPTCHLTMKEFKETGKFGCSNCYRTFENQLPNILKNFQGGNYTHQGKDPNKKRTIDSEQQVNETEVETDILSEVQSDSEKLSQLKLELQSCIAQERFEQAAVIRDAIHELEKRVMEANENVQ
ncbi:MAG: putative UvrB/UvrC domain protein [Bacillales bacterium]|nr:putative UvrB/UvrC domain protein [Bacillales bacterium]